MAKVDARSSNLPGVGVVSNRIKPEVRRVMRCVRSGEMIWDEGCEVGVSGSALGLNMITSAALGLYRPCKTVREAEGAIVRCVVLI